MFKSQHNLKIAYSLLIYSYLIGVVLFVEILIRNKPRTIPVHQKRPLHNRSETNLICMLI